MPKKQRELTIEQKDGGYVLRASQPKPGTEKEIYPDREYFEYVESDPAKVRTMMTDWMDGKAPPFEKPKEE